MKQIIASVFFDILSYTIGNNILCIFKNIELKKDRTTLTDICQRNGQRNNEIIVIIPLDLI